MNLVDPIFFAPNRVWRRYHGGELLDTFLDPAADGEDGHFPEDWLASTLPADNNGHTQDPEEGLARVLDTAGNPGMLLCDAVATHGEALLGPDHVQRFGTETGMLCKLRDPAVRLPIQCHPDKSLARELFNSDVGRAECWRILETRRIHGEDAYILLGFREGVTREAFAEAVDRQDLPTLASMLHKLVVRPGETYFVPPRMPHALGPGVFALQIQPPADWAIRAERFCGSIELSPEGMWGSLSPRQALDVFAYDGTDQIDLLRRIRPEPLVLQRSDEGYHAELIGSHHTPAFGLWQAEVVGRMKLDLPRGFALVACLAGEGAMHWSNGSREIQTGDYFLQPYAVPWIEYHARGRLGLVICLPPTPDPRD
ncbi:MAG: hypothetical protein GVY18_13795 [Bacteroidetes bacterium]|jgi:mannose-6-phosphate isomerase|nr:hypothetical protein [Bacteroidota bacterium]